MTDDGAREDGFGWYVEAGTGVEGYDSPVLIFEDGGFIDIGRARERFSSAYIQMAFGAYGGGVLGSGPEWSYAVDLEARRLPNLSSLDEDRLDIQAGVRWPQEAGGERAGHLRLRLLSGLVAFDGGTISRTSLGWAADARLKTNRHESRTLKLEWRRFEHDTDNDLMDADRLALTFGYSRGSPTGWAPLLAVRAALIREANRWDEHDLSFLRASLRAEISVTPYPDWDASVALEARHTRYRAPEPGLEFRRRDGNFILTLGLGYELEETARVDCELEWSRLHSNDVLYAGDSRVIGCAYKIEY